MENKRCLSIHKDVEEACTMHIKEQDFIKLSNMQREVSMRVVEYDVTESMMFPRV